MNGATFEACESKAESPHATFYHSNHDGTFTDVGEKAGVALAGPSRDLAVDHTGATFGVCDGDGWLDPFAGGDSQFDFKNPPVVGSKAAGGALCQYRGVNVMCIPRGLHGAGDHLFRNNGDGTLTDEGAKAGISYPTGYYGLGTLFADVNNDGRRDLVVANDWTPNYPYINKGDGTFDGQSYMNSRALNQDGREVANMGLGAGDYKNNRQLVLVSKDFYDDYDLVFHQRQGTGSLGDLGYRTGIAAPTMQFAGLGDGLLDYDKDDWKDLMIVNENVYPQADQHRDWASVMRRERYCFMTCTIECLHWLRRCRKPVWRSWERDGRSLWRFAQLRQDRRGDQQPRRCSDAAAQCRPDQNHWVELRLVRRAKSPKDAVGTTVYLTADGIRQRGDVLSGGSDLSSNDTWVHFVLGQATHVDALEIHRSSGRPEKVYLSAVNGIFTIEEGRGVTAAMCTTCAAGKTR